ncbi:MAG: hypothetical protein C4527_14665 [Candidatus Omnitrophota bacterium]|jgi:hypothetical protein|nr:MAG: hypothetical protein C4527_14665 [Candidatus Omnitrophota bacterium]
MESYVQTAVQMKEDVLSEFERSFPEIAGNDPYKAKPNVLRVLDNIEIVFRNSAKQKIFSERVRGIQKSRLDGDEILSAYLTTDDNDSYNDSLNSIGCSKKICFFLFTSRYNGFGLVERTKYTDILRKQETLCPAKNVEIYNVKKILADFMVEGNPTYANIQPLVTRYVQALRALLDSQRNIYQCEAELNEIFADCLDEFAQTGLNPDKVKLNPVSMKAMLQVFNDLRKRGLEIPEIKQNETNEPIRSICVELRDHQQNLLDECDILQDVVHFLDDVILYIEKAKQAEERAQSAKEKKEAGEDVGAFAAFRETFSSKFNEWLNR